MVQMVKNLSVMQETQVINAGSYFISQDEGMTESPVETLEKPLSSTSSGQRAS